MPFKSEGPGWTNLVKISLLTTVSGEVRFYDTSKNVEQTGRSILIPSTQVLFDLII